MNKEASAKRLSEIANKIANTEYGTIEWADLILESTSILANEDMSKMQSRLLANMRQDLDVPNIEALRGFADGIDFVMAFYQENEQIQPSFLQFMALTRAVIVKYIQSITN